MILWRLARGRRRHCAKFKEVAAVKIAPAAIAIIFLALSGCAPVNNVGPCGFDAPTNQGISDARIVGVRLIHANSEHDTLHDVPKFTPPSPIPLDEEILQQNLHQGKTASDGMDLSKSAKTAPILSFEIDLVFYSGIGDGVIISELHKFDEHYKGECSIIDSVQIPIMFEGRKAAHEMRARIITAPTGKIPNGSYLLVFKTRKDTWKTNMFTMK
jgi:hypothetical protein